MGRCGGNRQRPVVLFISLIAGLFTAGLFFAGCEPPFDFTETLDGETGKSLSITPQSAIVVVGEKLTLDAEGGVPPYTFAVTEGKGKIDEDSGEYTAPSKPGTDKITVTDAYETSSVATITIISGETGPSDPDDTIDYIIPNVTSDTGSVSRDSAVTERFDLKNDGNFDGSEPVLWEAYVSVDNTYSVGDTFISTGSTDPLDAGKSKLSIEIGGSWPYEGSYYLIVRAQADDETSSGWNYGYSGPFTVENTPDYSITSVSLPIIEYGGNPNENMNTAGPTVQEFYLYNDSDAATGTENINWNVYLSADTVIDGGDTVLASGNEAPLTPGTSSDPLPFGGDDNLPATAGLYYILMELSAGDDYNTGNNTYTSDPVFVWNTTNMEIDTTEDDTISSAEDYFIIINPGDTATVNGTLDQDPYSDFFKIQTGPGTAGLDISVSWTLPDSDVLDLYLYNSGGTLLDSSIDITKGSEPDSGGPAWTPAGDPNSVYYIEVRIDKNYGGGDPYVLTISG